MFNENDEVPDDFWTNVLSTIAIIVSVVSIVMNGLVLLARLLEALHLI